MAFDKKSNWVHDIRELEQAKILLVALNEFLINRIDELTKISDNVEKSHSEREKEQTRILISEIQDELNNKKKEIEKMAMTLSHEFRTPLVPILSYSQMLLQGRFGTLNDTQREKLKLVLSCTDALQNLVRDILNLYKADLGKLKLNLELVDINEIVDSVLERIEVLPNINIIKPEKNIQITCDQVKMESVILNIILNAIQAVGEKGQIIITAEESSSNILIKIQDSGPGVPREIMKKIFEPLVITKPKGTGLGLSICKNFVEQHKGTIRVKNNPTTFSISLHKMNF